jgi:hypothetical protein
LPGVVNVYGGRALRSALKKASGDLDALKTTHRQVAGIVATEARRLAPKRTGKLAGTVRPLAGQRYARVAIGNNRKTASGVPYAGPVYWGWPRTSPALKHVAPNFRTFTPHADPKWFIRPNEFVLDAARRTEPVWQRVYLAAIDDIVDTIGATSNGTGP